MTPPSNSRKDIPQSLAASWNEWNMKQTTLNLYGVRAQMLTKKKRRDLSRDFKKPFSILCGCWCVCFRPVNCHCPVYLRSSTVQPGSIVKRIVRCSEQPVSSFEPLQLTGQLPQGEIERVEHRLPVPIGNVQ